MYKAVIIDDEPIVLKGICQMISWEQLGIQVAATARDGQQGKLLIQKIRPHLVITDIRMPQMDGMELIRQAAKENPEVLFIIFSGYSEFQYAKEAISYGVMGYLEKPVDIDELKMTLERAKEILIGRDEKKKRESLAQKEENIKFFRSILDNVGRKDELPENVDKRLLESKWTIAVCQFAEGGETDGAVRFLEETLEKIKGNRMGKVVTKGRYIVIFLQTVCQRDDLEKIRKQLSSCGYRVRIGSALEYREFWETAELFKKSETVIQFQQFYRMYGLMFYEEIQQKNQKVPEDYRGRLKKAVRDGKEEETVRIVEQTLKSMEKVYMKPEDFRQGCLEILYACAEFMPSGKKENVREKIFGREQPYWILEECTVVEQAREKVLELIEKMFAVSREETLDGYHYKIIQAMDYIRKHYREDISLVQLAAITDMNPTYFSTLFKKSKGISYSQYLNEVRMERAKELLETDKKVTEVSEEVGYYNSRHFSECFKKYTGMTPKEYRNKE